MNSPMSGGVYFKPVGRKPLVKPSLIGRVKNSIRALVRDETLGDANLRELTTEFSYTGTSASQSALGYIGPYDPEGLDHSTLKKMRRDGVIKAGLIFKKAPILNSLRHAKISCPADPNIEKFLTLTFLPLLQSLTNSSLTALEYGVAFHEKVFKTDTFTIEYVDDAGAKQVAWDGYAIVPKKYKYNNPSTIDRIFIEEGTQDFTGYQQKPNIKIPSDKAFVFAVNTLNSLWGESELIPAYSYWYWKEIVTAYYLRYLERRATPPLIGRAPVGKSYSIDNDEEVDNLAWLTEVGANLRDGMVAVFPSELDARGNLKWDLHEMALTERGTAYQNAVNWLELAILRAMVVPDKPIAQMQTVGSYSLADVQFEAFLVISESLLNQFTDYIERYIIKQLVEFNFGPGAPEAKLQTQPLSDTQRDRIWEIFKAILVAHPYMPRLDLLKMAETLEIPVSREMPPMPGVPGAPTEEAPTEGQPGQEQTPPDLQALIDQINQEAKAPQKVPADG